MNKTLNKLLIKSSGFTLIEMMITVAIVIILATVAWSAYETQLDKGRRGDAIVGLKSVRQALISFKSDRGVFPADQAAAMNFLTGNTGYRPTAANAPPADCRTERGFQAIVGSIANSVRSCSWYWDIEVSLIDTTSFTLTATTLPGYDDDYCASLELNHLDAKNFSRTAKGTADGIQMSRCWAE